jgi:hypothetical protein
LGIVAIGIAGEDLVELLGQQGFAAVGDEFVDAGIGPSLSDVGQDAELSVEQSQGQESGIADDRAAI